MAKRHSHRIGDLESLFVRLEELVVASSGADEFEEVFTLLIAKLWDERCGRDLRLRSGQSETETYEVVRTLLQEADTAWPGILDRSLEPGLTPAHLHVCVDALRNHRLSDASFEVLDGLFEFLVAKGSKGAKGQYFTPRHVIELCVRMLEPTAAETILDPACGSGGFLVHALNYVREHERLAPEEVRAYCSDKLWGCDIDARAVRIAKALMVLVSDGSAHILRLNSLVQSGMRDSFPKPSANGAPSATIETACSNRVRLDQGFDIILTNPPFAGEVRETQVLAGYGLARGKSRIERDLLFLERCVGLLRPGGRMAIILPHNKLAAESFGYVREWLFDRTRVLGVVGLGRNTFLPHTHQKAVVLVVRKVNPAVREPRDPRIFFAISQRDGKNSKGQFLTRAAVSESEPAWSRVDHDLGEILDSYREFCASDSVPERARCPS